MRILIALCVATLAALIVLTAAKLAAGPDVAAVTPTPYPSLIPTAPAAPTREPQMMVAPATPPSAATAALPPTLTPLPALLLADQPPAGMAPQPTPRVISAAPPLSARFKVQPGDRLTLVRRGVFHVRRITSAPLRINVLLFDLEAPEFDLAVGLRDGWLSGRARTSGLAREYEALAAVNGDLFAENGLPQGLTLIDGRAATAPKRRATFAWSREGEPFIGYFTEEWTWQAEVRAAAQARFPITLLNQPCVQGQICLYNDFAGSLPARAGAVVVRLDPGGNITAVVREKGLRLKAHERALLGTGAGATWLREHAALGERLDIQINTDPPLRAFSHAISGGPIILRNGEFVQDCMCALNDCSRTAQPKTRLRCEDFSTDWKEKHYLTVRMPRTGIGFDRERQTLIVAVVDGYQAGYSRGITQRDFADLLKEFGADEAMELDGGGSSTMVLEGKVINRPPDQSGERYIANALLFFWREQVEGSPSRRQ